ncbi:MAG: hypothetical protein QF486_00025 [Candidatus Woesearchaeota archaeon]|jgi:hypothetical protein|nr:hypothetical protein [Candidatus Woesearchaeota archaeon]MDP7181389.1 hypothetical protein [Candidatus Woesearchaeota archaeon]MDP7197993.1 hypothetical protein [Candidatus Woesearchaeota archaeon]MDP7466827.1 hypothetical protein [Candidatus Woesearchaeota archaeon]MDP7648052.1 hypothetical protein [Candidatus Woesearchaeota archaeon]|tara:strand:- start:216 stop:539 length:324 start_codon:yes stop_codon:yes gene_type:complete
MPRLFKDEPPNLAPIVGALSGFTTGLDPAGAARYIFTGNEDTPGGWGASMLSDILTCPSGLITYVPVALCVLGAQYTFYGIPAIGMGVYCLWKCVSSPTDKETNNTA